MSTSDVVVVSAGGGGWWSAAAARAPGRSVRLVSHGPSSPPPGWADGPLTDPGPAGAAVFGALSPVAVERAVLARGAVVALPFERAALGRLVSGSTLPTLLADLARARARTEAAALVGGGSEQRTYRDWVVRRFGETAFRVLFAAYAERRFGPPEEVVASLARATHEGGWSPVAPADGGVTARAHLAEVAHTAGEVQSVAAGRVVTAGGTFEGEVWLDAPPALALGWLEPALAEELRHEVARMTTRPAAQVALRGGAALPYETHLLDTGVPCWRVRRPGLLPGGGDATRLVAAVAGPPAEAGDAELVDRVVLGLRSAGVDDVDGADAVVRRLPGGAPVWGRTHFARLRAWTNLLAAADLTPVGGQGLAAPLDAGQEVAIALALAGPDAPTARALVRDVIEPPTVDGPERAHLTRFIVR